MSTSNRANFRNIFFGGRSDRLLWIPDLTWWRDAGIAHDNLEDRYRGSDGFLRLHTDLGVMPYYIYAIEGGSAEEAVSAHQIGGSGRPYNGVWGMRLANVERETKQTGDELEIRYHLGGEQLVQRKAYLRESSCYAFLEYPVKTPGDLETLLRIVEGFDFYPTHEDFTTLYDSWGEAGVPVAPLPRSPLSSLIVDWMGLERFIFAFEDYPAEVRAVLDAIDNANDRAFDIVTASDAEVFHFCDNLSASNYASYFGELAAPYYRKRVSQLHGAGKQCVSHLDGTVVGLLDQLAATGVDGVEALTTAPVGDIATKDLRREARDESVLLWGSLPAALFTDQFPMDLLERQISDLMQQYTGDHRMIAGSADQIPPNADIGRVKFISDYISDRSA